MSAVAWRRIVPGLLGLLLAAAALSGSAARGLEAFAPHILTLGGAAPQVPPPRGARWSATVLQPDEMIGSSFMHLSVFTYRSTLSADAIYAYYAPRLRRLGYLYMGGGQGCSVYSGCQDSFWQFSRSFGQRDSIVISVHSEGRTRLYSVALELIVVPPRPSGSFVPSDVEEATVSAKAGSGPWVSVRVTSPEELRRLRQIVNRLPVGDVLGRHSCSGLWASTKVTLSTPYADYRFSEPLVGCFAVRAPGGVILADLGWPLWHEVSRLTHVAWPSP